MSVLIEYWTYTEQTKFEVFDHSEEHKCEKKSLLFSGETTIYFSTQAMKLKTKEKLKEIDHSTYEPFLIAQKHKGTYYISNAHLRKNQDSEKDMLCLIATPKIPSQKSILLKELRPVNLGLVKLYLDKLHLSRGRIKKKTFYDEQVFREIEQKNRVDTDFYEDSSKASTIDIAPSCRYCFSKSLDDQNYFLFLCKCEGSSKYVHVMCLTAWVKQRCRYTKLGNGLYSAEKKGLTCEICKELFPIEEVLPCFLEEKIQEYAILSVITETKQMVYVIKLQGSKSFTVGRKSECDISIDDSSVSRSHCLIDWDSEKGNLRIMDMNSKFGTLVKKSSLSIEEPAIMQKGMVKMRMAQVSRSKAIVKTISEYFCSSKEP